MPTLGGNYIDLIILVAVGLYIMEGLERGFWVLFFEFVSFLGSLAIALKAYSIAAEILVANFTLPNSFANAIGFILVAIVAQTILGVLSGLLAQKLPEHWWKNWWSRALSVFPAIGDSLIFIAALLTLLVSIPISPKVKADVTNSKIGGALISQTAGLEHTLTKIFGGTYEDTLTFLTIKPQSNERVDLGYKSRTLAVDEMAEVQMLELVNQERARVGARPLRADSEIVEVARAHSRDMWERQYFAHINPDGKDPFDRMKEGGVEFRTAGENLALAPTTSLAHQGLMNSEGHKRNILDPTFGRVGIGVIDGGIYGKMFTQNFAD